MTDAEETRDCRLKPSYHCMVLSSPSSEERVPDLGMAVKTDPTDDGPVLLLLL